MRRCAPTASGGSVVLCFSRWRNRAALIEILARCRGDLGRRRKINDRFRTLRRGNRQKLGETYKARDQAAALIAECGDESRMQAIGSHARAMKTAGEFTLKRMLQSLERA